MSGAQDVAVMADYDGTIEMTLTPGGGTVRMVPGAETLTQADIDAAQAEAEAAAACAVEVRDIPGLNTIAHSDDKDSWRAARERRGAISATAITAVMGTSPFATILDLWRERMEGKRPTFSAFQQTIMLYGTMAEPELVAEANAHVAGSPSPAPFVLTHGYVDSLEHPGFGCTPDAWRIIDAVLELAEFKTGSKSWRKTPRSKPVVPANYVDQCQWQMLVTDARRVLVVYRQVERDRQGNVTAILGHEFVWVERDEARIAKIIDAVRAYLQDEADLIPPMTYLDVEDQFDDAPERTAENAAVRDALSHLAAADAVLAEDRYLAAQELRASSLSRLKAIMQSRKGRQVILNAGGYGATLSRTSSTSYDVSMLTAKQRERIASTTTKETLRTTADRKD